MSRTEIKYRFSYNLYLYKIALLCSIIILPLIIAALSNDVTLSYSIGVISFILFVTIYNVKKSNNNRKSDITKKDTIINEKLNEIDLLMQEVKHLNLELHQKNNDFLSFKKSFEYKFELEKKNIELRTYQEKELLANQMFFLSHAYEDLILKNRMYSETFNIFLKDFDKYSNDFYRNRYLYELFQKLNEENQQLVMSREKLNDYIEKYLKQE